jgi:hypothetical protein
MIEVSSFYGQSPKTQQFCAHRRFLKTPIGVVSRNRPQNEQTRNRLWSMKLKILIKLKITYDSGTRKLLGRAHYIITPALIT